MELKRQIGLGTAILIIIADVIGTGIFMNTTGYVLKNSGDALVVLILWAVAGVVAITGSLCYAELASIWPDDGGEYVYLKKIFGFLPSFLTGWVSMVVAFSLAAALTSVTVVVYLNRFIGGDVLAGEWTQKLIAAGIVFFFGVVHIIGVNKGSIVQNLLTLLKLLIVFSLIGFGFYFADWSLSDRLVNDYGFGKDFSFVGYGSLLIMIMYAYSGWNGATYIAGEIKDPKKNLPKALFWGPVIITLIYLALNVVFLISSPAEQLIADNAVVGSVSTQNLFGANFSPIFSISIAVILLSSVSAQMMIGPRVYYAMAKDRMTFSSLSRINPKFQTPDFAIILQMFIAITYVFIGGDKVFQLLIYMGFALSVFPLLCVIGMVILRYKQPELERSYRVPFFPLTPLIYIILTSAMMVTSLITNTVPSLFAVGVLAVGVVVFYLWQKAVAGK